MNIRKATSKDSANILRLLKVKAEFDRSMGGFTGEITSTEEKIISTLFGKMPLAYVLFIEDDNDIQGFAFYHYRYSSFSGTPSIWLDDILVLEEFRSKKLGFYLMQSLQSEARKIGASHISWTASPCNQKGLLFYERLGAKVEKLEGKRPFYKWEVNA